MGTEYLSVKILLQLLLMLGDCAHSSLQYPQVGLYSARHGAYCDDLRARGKIQALPVEITNPSESYVQVLERPNTGK